MEKKKRQRLVFIAILVSGLAIRFLLAPYTTGSDIAQFAGFADTFLRHGLCFYKYSGMDSYIHEGWPYNWPYVYGPILILFLGLLRLFIRTDVIHYYDILGHYYVYVPTEWIIACKSLFILFDTLSAVMIYLIIKKLAGNTRKALLGMSIYFFNPMVIYVSSIYGMFDPIALFFILLALDLLLRNKRVLSSVLMGLSLVTKQTMLFSIVYHLLSILRREGIKKFLIQSFVIIGVSTIIMAPFMVCPGSLRVFLDNLAFASTPTYTYPISYSFNGFSSLATYLHSINHIDTLWVMRYWFVPAIILTLLYVLALVKGKNDLVLPFIIGYLVYIATYWRVNAQYLLPGVAFLVLALFHPAVKGRAKLPVAVSIFLMGFWPIMFPTSWWAHVHIRHPNMFIWKLLDFFSLMVFGRIYYVCYSMLLTITLYVTIITLISRMHIE